MFKKRTTVGFNKFKYSAMLIFICFSLQFLEGLFLGSAPIPEQVQSTSTSGSRQVKGQRASQLRSRVNQGHNGGQAERDKQLDAGVSGNAISSQPQWSCLVLCRHQPKRNVTTEYLWLVPCSSFDEQIYISEASWAQVSNINYESQPMGK